jgi:hypothetical protein
MGMFNGKVSIFLKLGYENILFDMKKYDTTQAFITMILKGESNVICI